MWIELTVPVTPKSREVLSHWLFEIGAVGLIERDDEFITYFAFSEKENALEKFVTQLRGRDKTLASLDVRARVIEEQDWGAAWRENFKPVFVSDGIVVCPPWQTLPERPGRRVLIIEPKMAFGTGTHATTQMVLRLLEQWVRGGEEVLDIGTGTGILAIAAVKLGAASVTAVDHDPVAVEAAKENLVLNDVRHRVRLIVGRVDCMKPRVFPVVLGNLDRPTLLSLLRELKSRLAPQCVALLSGFLLEEEEHIMREMARAGFKILQREEQEGWLAFAVKPVEKILERTRP